jgi:hypothetical protein
LNDAFSSKEVQELQAPQASKSSVLLVQLMVLAKILAQVVFPTPLGPQKRKAWAK